jgi:putative endonuclease
MYYTYVLKSLKDGKYYIGSTSNIENRLCQHNDGLNKSTKDRRPLEVVFKKEFTTRTEALKFEMLLKKQKGGVGFKRLTLLG